MLARVSRVCPAVSPMCSERCPTMLEVPDTNSVRLPLWRSSAARENTGLWVPYWRG